MDDEFRGTRGHGEGCTGATYFALVSSTVSMTLIDLSGLDSDKTGKPKPKIKEERAIGYMSEVKSDSIPKENAESNETKPLDETIAKYCIEVQQAFLADLDHCGKIDISKNDPATDISKLAENELLNIVEVDTPESTTLVATKENMLAELEVSIFLKAFLAASKMASFRHYFPDLESYFPRFRIGNQHIARVLLSKFPFISQICKLDLRTKNDLGQFMGAIIDVCNKIKQSGKSESQYLESVTGIDRVTNSFNKLSFSNFNTITGDTYRTGHEDFMKKYAHPSTSFNSSKSNTTRNWLNRTKGVGNEKSQPFFKSQLSGPLGATSNSPSTAVTSITPFKFHVIPNTIEGNQCFHNISAMDSYKKFSLEELRLQDYKLHLRFPASEIQWIPSECKSLMGNHTSGGKGQNASAFGGSSNSSTVPSSLNKHSLFSPNTSSENRLIPSQLGESRDSKATASDKSEMVVLNGKPAESSEIEIGKTASESSRAPNSEAENKIYESKSLILFDKGFTGIENKTGLVSSTDNIIAKKIKLIVDKLTHQITLFEKDYNKGLKVIIPEGGDWDQCAVIKKYKSTIMELERVREEFLRACEDLYAERAKKFSEIVVEAERISNKLLVGQKLQTKALDVSWKQKSKILDAEWESENQKLDAESKQKISKVEISYEDSKSQNPAAKRPREIDELYSDWERRSTELEVEWDRKSKELDTVLKSEYRMVSKEVKRRVNLVFEELKPKLDKLEAECSLMVDKHSIRALTDLARYCSSLTHEIINHNKSKR